MPVDSILDETPPRIPGFEILSELGRGAMGVVYRAKQSDLGRIVALKMILPREKVRESDLIRFQTEAEAAAALQHPNVAQLYEIGRHEGRPYFAMEFCPGGALQDLLQENVLAPREAADLVRTLAFAIQSAHDLGILHRDLKPANVLLSRDLRRESGSGSRDSKVIESQQTIHASSNDTHEVEKPKSGRMQSTNSQAVGSRVTTPDSRYPTPDSRSLFPKITDFGMAKRFDPGTGEAASNLTHAGTIIGTPSYMSPEQADGNSSTLSDVYSLGAILYHCLTGRPPFKGATALDTLMDLLDKEPVPPSKLAAKIPPDLEAICLKCLEKKPEKRYQTAAALAEDLDRFLNNLPTLARPLSTWAQTVKWAKRKPAVAALVAVGFVSMLGFAGLSMGLWRALGEADRQRARAVGTNEIALGAIDDILRQDDVPGASDPEMQRQAMLDSVSRSLTRLAEYGGNDRELLSRSAKAYLRRGRLLVDIAKLDDAVATYTQAADLAQRQLDKHPNDVSWRRELATAKNRIGGVYDRKGDAARATAAFQEAEDLRRALFAETNAPDDEHDLAVTLFNRAGVDADLADKPADAAKRFDESCKLLKEVVAKEPDRLKYRDSLAFCWYNWGRHLSHDDNRNNDAIEALNKAKKIWTILVGQESESLIYQTKLAECLVELGKVHHQNNALDHATDNYTAALTVWRDVSKRHPKVATFQGMLGQACSHMGQLADVGTPEERMKLLGEGVRALNGAQALPVFRIHLANAFFALAKAQQVAGHSDAKRSIDQAITHYEELTKLFPHQTEFRDKLESARHERGKMSDL